MGEILTDGFPGPMTEREMEWARILVHRRLDEKKTEEVRAIFDRMDKSHEALRLALARAEADLAAAKAERERLTRERDEARQIANNESMIQEQTHEAMRLVGEELAASRRCLAQEEENVNGLYATMCEQGEKLTASIARERTMRACLGDIALATSNALTAGIEQLDPMYGRAMRAINEKATAALSTIPTGEGCEECKRLRGALASLVCAVENFQLHDPHRETDARNVWRLLGEAVEVARAALSAVPTGEGCEECRRLRDVLRDVLHYHIETGGFDGCGEPNETTALDELAHDLMHADLLRRVNAALAHAEGETHEERKP